MTTLDNVGRYRTAQQQASVATLVEIVALGLASDAEPLHWSVGYNVVEGTVGLEAMYRDTPLKIYRRWVELLGATEAEPEAFQDGYTVMSASRAYGNSHTAHTIVVRLHLPPSTAY